MLPWADLQQILWGFGLSLLLLVCGLLVSLLGGLVIALAQLSPAKWLRWPAVMYVECIRGLPMLFLVYFLYFGIIEVVTLSEFPAAVLAFGITYSAFIGEVYRAGILSVDPGQTEAARALGLSSRRTMRFVVMPQAIRNILPALGNESIALWKDTALASAIGAGEMMRQARIIGGRTFNFFEVLLYAGVLYILVSLVLSQLQRARERRFGAERTVPA
jgi:His/Glu/Gln/Arg/opine family amino acid ABC transporter permease subunit